jgi:hypothetical protein
MLSDMEVKYSASSVPVGGTGKKCPFGIIVTAPVVVVVFLFTVWKVPLPQMP